MTAGGAIETRPLPDQPLKCGLDLATASVKHQLASPWMLWRLSEVVAGWLAASV